MSEPRQTLAQGNVYAFTVGDHGVQLRVGTSKLVNGRFALTLLYPVGHAATGFGSTEVLVGVLRNLDAAVALVAFLDEMTESVQAAINHHTRNHHAEDEGERPGSTGS